MELLPKKYGPSEQSEGFFLLSHNLNQILLIRVNPQRIYLHKF